jgi:hypothetical protein
LRFIFALSDEVSSLPLRKPKWQHCKPDLAAC